MIHVYVYIRTIVVLTGGKLTEFYFLHLLSVMMHLRSGKKVSDLSPGDVNPRPAPQDEACLRTIHIVRYALRVYHATSHDRTPRAWGPRNVLWMPSARREYILIMYAALSVQS
jgi:hypothetical protein